MNRLNTIFMALILLSVLSSAQANKIVDKVVEAKNKVIQSDLRQRKILGTLYGLSKEIKSISKKRSELEKELFSAEGEIKDLSREIAKLTLKIKTQKVHLGKRIQTIYKFNNMGALALLLNSKGGNVDKHVKYLKLIAKQDVEYIKKFHSKIRLLENKKLDLKKNVAQLIRVQKRVRKSEKKLESNQLAKTKILRTLRKDKKKAMRNLKIWRRQAKSLKFSDEDLKGLLESEFFENKGKLHWPVNGEIYKKYGLHYDEKYKFKLNERGVQFESLDKEVRTVFSGVIEFVGKVNNLHEVVIVNHGDNYFTVYGNLDEVNVLEGDQIQTGEVIASVDIKKHNKLSFQIRHFSDPVNPENWFSKKLLVSNE